MSDDPWVVSGPEEGDKIDQTVLVCCDLHDEWEIIEITAAIPLNKRVSLAKRICKLLNQAEAKVLI